MKMKSILLMMGILIFLVSGCKSDEPSKELTIDDLLYSAWNGKETETLENGEVKTIKFIILFTSVKQGQVTFLNNIGTPIQNFPIYYEIEGGIFHLKGAFKGDYRVLNHTHQMLEMEAYLPNHSLITLTRK